MFFKPPNLPNEMMKYPAMLYITKLNTIHNTFIINTQKM